MSDKMTPEEEKQAAINILGNAGIAMIAIVAVTIFLIWIACII